MIATGFEEAKTRGRDRLRASLRRLRVSALPIVQCGLSAGIAWWVATVLVGHEQPFFAPIAAVVSLGLSMGARLRRSVELVIGVAVGVTIGDLLVWLIGGGTWQIALVVMLAMAAAVLLDGGPIIAMQAGNSAVLIAALIPSGHGTGIDRTVDALVGGLVGIVVLAVIPTHPVGRARRDAAAILDSAEHVLRLVHEGLLANNDKPIVAALKKARATQSSIDDLREHVAGGREISRISPFYWSARHRMRNISSAVDPLDSAMRNIRVLARRSLSVVLDDEILDPRLVKQIGRLADAIDVLRRMVLADPGEKPSPSDAARVLRSVASELKPELLEGAGVSATVVFAQLRSLLTDLLQVAGLKRISALATLPPTVEHPGYSPDA
ncbi:MAG: aromatic acid exporter family protein [Rhodococcus sp.]|nr:aromatic acid exporter family protein [Rhodococcus sp. (in: high G+C Gram-positive bacteria)]